MRIDRTRVRRRIQYLADANWLQWLVDQETWQVGGLKFLEDEAMLTLLSKIERMIGGDAGAQASAFRPVVHR